MKRMIKVCPSCETCCITKRTRSHMYYCEHCHKEFTTPAERLTSADGRRPKFLKIRAKSAIN